MNELICNLRSISRAANRAKAKEIWEHKNIKANELEAKLNNEVLLINEFMILIANTGATQFTTLAIRLIGKDYRISYANEIKLSRELVRLFESPSKELINRLKVEGYSVNIRYDEDTHQICELVITWF